MFNELREFLALSYSELEELNLEAKEQRKNRVSPDKIREERLKYLTDEKRIKAVTVLFSDLEGRLHMLDYDKKFLLKSWDNLTFDGSSIRGFTAQKESDLRLGIDWAAFYWAPADFFGPGKVMVFGDVIEKQGGMYAADIRGVLKDFADKQHKAEGYTLNAANEIEGFLFKGVDAERHFHETGKFDYVNTGGYYHSLPGDSLRTFIDTTAEVQRSMGFQNGGFHRALLAFPLDLSLERLLRHCRLASNTPRCCRIVEVTALVGSAAEVRRIKKKGQSPDRVLRKRRTMSSRSSASRRCLRSSAETIVTSASSPLTLDGE